MSTLDLLILALATWRLSVFLVHEKAPFEIMTRLRARFALGGLLTCVYCMSIWVSAGLYYIFDTPVQPIVYILSISGAALMLRSYTGAGIHDL